MMCFWSLSKKYSFRVQYVHLNVSITKHEMINDGSQYLIARSESLFIAIINAFF
jgi:hypothetical protein